MAGSRWRRTTSSAPKSNLTTSGGIEAPSQARPSWYSSSESPPLRSLSAHDGAAGLLLDHFLQQQQQDFSDPGKNAAAHFIFKTDGLSTQSQKLNEILLKSEKTTDRKSRHDLRQDKFSVISVDLCFRKIFDKKRCANIHSKWH